MISYIVSLSTLYCSIGCLIFCYHIALLFDLRGSYGTKSRHLIGSFHILSMGKPVVLIIILVYSTQARPFSNITGMQKVPRINFLQQFDVHISFPGRRHPCTGPQQMCKRISLRSWQWGFGHRDCMAKCGICHRDTSEFCFDDGMILSVGSGDR